MVAETPERRQIRPPIIETESFNYALRVSLSNEKPEINDATNSLICDEVSTVYFLLYGVKCARCSEMTEVVVAPSVF